LLELADNIVQALRRQLVLAFASLGDRCRSFGRNSAMQDWLHLGGDAIRLEGEAVSLGSRRQKRRQHDPRFGAVGGHADDHAAPFQRAKSEPDRDHGFASYHVCARQDREAFDNIIVHALVTLQGIEPAFSLFRLR
jgi:hypothetical protein